MTREEIHKLPWKAQEYINELERKLTLTDVIQQRELLIALLRETDLEYIQHQDCPEILAEDIIKAIYSI